MKKKLVVGLAIVLMVAGITGTAEADFYVRGQGTSTHGTYNLIYDDYFDITWYDFSIAIEDEGSSPDWSWGSALTWADNLSVVFYGATYEDWRLPDPYNHDGSGPQTGKFADSEMSHLYRVWGGVAGVPPFDRIGIGFEGGGLPLFPRYWSGVEFDTIQAWTFYFYSGYQGYHLKSYNSLYACAVRPGDVPVAPPEITCNNVDENLNGMADDAPDSDADSYDVCNPADPGDKDGLSADCNDGDASIYPGATDILCDGIDQDCSSADYCPCADSDTDGDGYGVCPDCGVDKGCTYDGDDCNDGDDTIYPGAREITCNGVDENCSGIDDDAPDADADSYDACNPADPGDADGLAVDCNDCDASIYPGATEVPCDSIDQDCSGVDSCDCTDIDNDGYGNPGTDTCPAGPETDCDDDDVSVYPGATDGGCDGTDQDCSGADNCDCTDIDGDGYGNPGADTCPAGPETDCDDDDVSVYPGATESACDGIDQDCSGVDVCPAVSLPRTGQTECYDADGYVIDCAGTGQDADIQAGVEWPDPRFTDNGNGTITDNLTGLVWLQDANLFGKRTWEEAISDCRSLADDGVSLTDCSVPGDWRLPNVVELESLVNLATNPGWWLNNQGFSNVQYSQPDYGRYWSATRARYVQMSDGCVTKYLSSPTYYVWPVRGGQPGPAQTWQTGETTVWERGDDGDIQAGVEWPEPRFVDNNDGTVTDYLTGLVWLKDANCFGQKSWPDALSDCNTLASGSCGLADGFVAGDWRLPNRKELFSLIDVSQFAPPLHQDAPFDNVNFQYYWSATTSASRADRAWSVRMYHGESTYLDKPVESYYVWPVRAWPAGSLCADNDEDGYGVCPDCYISNGCTYNGDDCNDGDSSINPAATEITCNGVDENCNGMADDAPDADNDSYDICNPADPGDTDGLPADLNDGVGSINPGATERTCNGIDENCNGMADDAPDSDIDSYDICNPADPGDTDGLAADCNDGDGSINPGATDVYCDGIDQDCSGPDNCPCQDFDRDGYGAPGDGSCTKGAETDCDDSDDSINPGQEDVYCDGIDQDCSGPDNCPCQDFDRDGYGAPGDDACTNGSETDCNDSDAMIYPGATETPCDGIDQDCSGADNCPCTWGPAHSNRACGVNRSGADYSTGSCAHCHDTFDDTICGVNPLMLFSPNYSTSQTENFCYECHKGVGTLQGPAFDNYNYTQRANGYTHTDFPTNVLDVFNDSSLGLEGGSVHDLTSIKNSLNGQWGYTGDSNPCSACHNPHKAQKDAHTAGGRGWPVSRPSSHALPSTWESWGDDPDERMNQYTTYQAPYALCLDNSPDATYTIHHDQGSAVVTKDQRLNAGTWISLGSYSFDGEDDYVELAQSPDGVVIADAIKCSPMDESEEIIVDNPDGSPTGSWLVSSTLTGYYGGDYQFCEEGSGAGFRWTIAVGTPGTYEVFVRWVGVHEPDSSSTQDGSNLTDYVTLCTDCHTEIAWDMEKHGQGSGQFGDGSDDYEDFTEVKAPYEDTTRYVLACTDCHEPHGSMNNYMIRPYVNNVWVRVKEYGLGYGPNTREWTEWIFLCRACHNGLDSGGHLHPDDIDGDGDDDCVFCHPKAGTYRSPCHTCHKHGKIFLYQNEDDDEWEVIGRTF